MDIGACLLVPRFINGAFNKNHSSNYSTLLFFVFNSVPIGVVHVWCMTAVIESCNSPQTMISWRLVMPSRGV